MWLETIASKHGFVYRGYKGRGSINGMLAMFTTGRNFCILGFGKALCQQWHTLLGYEVKETVLNEGERKF